MRRRASKKLKPVLFVLAVGAAFFFAWESSHFVFANWTQKHVALEAQNVTVRGWYNPSNAAHADLPEDAPAQLFDTNNSAYLRIESRERPQVPEVVSEPERLPVPVMPSPSDSAEPLDTATSSLPVVEPPPAPDAVPVGDRHSESIPSADAAPEVVVPLPAPAPPSIPEADVLEDAAEEVASSSAALPGAFFGVSAQSFAQILWGVLIPQVYAATSSEELPAPILAEPIEDVALCVLTESECHTVEAASFLVSEELRAKKFEGAEVKFSFGSKFLAESTEDDRIIVRYYHDGEWRGLGEIYLNKEFSNAVNGGYFVNALPEIETWEDLGDVRVVVEYVRADEYNGAEMYLDALWIDVAYKDRPQEITDAEVIEAVTSVPENLADALRGEESDTAAAPIAESGIDVSFPYTDNLGDALMIRTHQASYGRASEDMYISITNTTEVEESFTLAAALPAGVGDLSAAAQLLRNVPQKSATPVYEDVTYFCESGWYADASTTGALYACLDIPESYACATLTEDTTNCLVQAVVVGEAQDVHYESAWVARAIAREGALLSDISPKKGYRAIAALEEPVTVFPGQSVYFKLTFTAPGKGALRFQLFAEGNNARGDLDSEVLEAESLVGTRAKAPLKEALASKKGLTRKFGAAEFNGDQLPEFTFNFNSRRGVISRAFNAVLGRGNTFGVEAVTFLRADGVEETIPFEVSYGKDGEWTMKMSNRPRTFRPGKYTATIAMHEGSDRFSETVEFYWGMIVMNADKSVYAPGNTVNFNMAVLDEVGDTVCDADLGLTVTRPDGSTDTVPIATSGLCGDNNVVEVADYLAEYGVGDAGVYRTELSVSVEGVVQHRVFDELLVEPISPYVIRRSGATRIYPVARYAMTIEITAAVDVSGEFIESMPKDFTLLDAGGGEVRMYGSAKNLAWPLKLNAGERATVTYIYDAPDISPYLYMLGPAEIHAGEGQSFSEGRQWKLASDATGNMILYWDQTFIPTGWTCVSCLPADVFYQRFIMGSSTPGLNGGSATVTHTATGAVAASAGSQGVDTNNQATPTVAHTHTYTPTIGSTSTLPRYRQLAVIQYNSTGQPPLIPAGAIAMFDAAVPSGWTTYTAQDDYFVRAESTSTVGTTGGSNTHIHSIGGSTLGSAGTINIRNPGTSVTVASAGHTHVITANTGAVSNVPPHIGAIFGKVTATSTAPDGMIAMWTGDPGTGWGTVSSTSEPFLNRFAQASTTYGTTGGNTTHTHADVTGITSGAPVGTATRDSTPVNGNVATQNHTHSVNVTAFSTNSHIPPYRTAVFAKRMGGDTPTTTIEKLFDGEKTATSTPWFEITGNDPDGSDTLVYQFQWDDDADLDSSPLGDRTSDDETGCSPACFSNISNGGDTSPFDDNAQIRFKIQTPLVSGTTYYARARAQSTATSTWGAWATTTSFTYVAGTDPSQWMQTEDAQFDSNTLNGIETYGSNSARLSLADPVEALIAYGEGVVQTPRYRLWDGSAWGAEASAQSVGGTIQWVVTRAGVTRDEYILGTQDASNDVNVQVYDGVVDTWGDLLEVTAGVANTARRAFDIAYESSSGDALVVYCDGDADPSYYVWNGSNWTGPGSVNVSSANNCEYIKLASDPASDEIIVVTRDTAGGTNDYEAQVWDGNAWAFPKILGGMIDTAHEGIAIEYEESGNQAVLVTSNGGTSGFVWSSWDGTQWGITTPQSLGDDFEWGRLRADVGSDAMSLCYIDQDADVGVLWWDGNSWPTWSAATYERTQNGNANTGRAADCAYETTSGRDGYLMLTYASTSASGYQYYNGSAWSVHSLIDTVQSTWTVNTIRTGEGDILSFFHDDVNARYDFSYWNGASWSTRQALESSPSVTVTPFLQPIDMAAKVYVSGSGDMTTRTIDFDEVPGRQTWGDVLWNTTESAGTDVVVQLYYETGGSCSTLIPDGDLTDNSTGFDVSESPLNISNLSTSTYNRICLKSTFSTANQSLPVLEDWTLTWERQPYLTQDHYRWYVNAAASLTPSDLWPSGGTDLVQDTAISTSYSPPGYTDILRLRMSILDENVSLDAGGLSLTLQYAEGATCSTDLTWLDVGEIGSTTAAWRGYDNAALSDGATLPSNLISEGDVQATYEEENDSSTNPNSATAGQDVEWDWVLQHNASSSISYCFRAVTSDGNVLDDYTSYPALTTNAAPSSPALTAPFDNELTASTSPWFDFSAEDPESNDITYQIQIDDDYAFGSPAVNMDSQTNQNEFNNIITPADKDPFNSGQEIRFIPSTPLSNGVTYYWRVRGKDRNNSKDWGSWSTIYSVGIDTSVTVSTWRQTTDEQFATDTLEDAEVSGSDTVVITSPFVNATTTSSYIDFDWKTRGNSWGAISWTDTETSSDITYHVEYLDDGVWDLIPDADLAANSVGFDTSPISLLGLSPTTYNQIRLRADMTHSGASPILSDWKVEWAYAVAQPTLSILFDNEKTSTTTPTFRFTTTDPQDDDLIYQISFSQTTDYAASTTRSSDLDSGFLDYSSTTDTTSPFDQGETIQFKLQPADALTNGNTYWWRVRARDPVPGGDAWSAWSDSRSFTIDTSVTVGTWFQTTDSQLETDTLDDIESSGSGSARITSIIREAFTAYSEGVVQTPRFRIWNGSTWGAEQSALTVGDTIRFVEVDAAPTRDEYLIATQGATGGIDVQVVNGTTDVSGNKVRMVSVVSDLTQRGMDVAYETQSGDGMMVSCSGTEAVYRTWDGASWSATSSLTLAVSGNCEWIKLASDPASDEIILVARDATTGAVDFQALVWDGTSSWGNSYIIGGQQATPNSEGMVVEYEESGDQAIVAVANGTANNFIWTYWNGATWAATTTFAISNDFAGGRLKRDLASDKLAFCYTDVTSDHGYVEWSGSGWTGAAATFEVTGNSGSGRPITCEYETLGSRDGYLMIPSSDTAQSEYWVWNGALLTGPGLLSTVPDSWELRSVRTGDGNILVVAYNDGDTDIDFSYWNGSTWSPIQILESTSIATVVPATIPVDIVARRYPTITSGAITSTAADFNDGLGPKWGSVSWSDSTPGASDILYRVEYYTSTSSWALIPDLALPYNDAGTSTGPIDLTNINTTTYNQLRLRANFACAGINCPTLSDWTLAWAEGVHVTGTAKQFDQTTNLTSGTVYVAVNGELQMGKTATISGGAFDIPNVTAFAGDVVTVWIASVADTSEAVAVTKYDGTGDITGMNLFERHLVLGSADSPTLTNANLSAYDNSISGNEDVFFNVDAGNDFTLCAASGCYDARLLIQSGTTYQPDAASSGTVTTRHLQIDGAFLPDANTINVAGSWDNNGTFTASSSSVIFTATSTTETIDTGSSNQEFFVVTFGTSNAATWNLATALNASSTLSINFGTLSQNGAHAINLSRDLSIGANGNFTKGTASTTFMGAIAATWTDASAAKQDLGIVVIDGAAKSVSFGSNVKATDVTIESDDTLSAGSSYGISVLGDWTNRGTFTAQNGTVTFASTGVGEIITPGTSSFYNLVFDGSGGNWSFTSQTATTTNDFTITNGTLTLPTGTTTIGGSFAVTSGDFMHNNGVVLFNGSAAETIAPATYSFYDLAFNGAGSWTFPSGNATSSRHTILTTGTLTAPSNTFAIGGSFARNGGTFTANSGTLKFTATNAQTLRLNNSDAYNLYFSGAGGSWSFVDTNATSTNTVRIDAGTLTLPSGTLAVGGSWLISGSGAFTHNSGAVRFNSTDTGESISPNGSWFANLIFSGTGGGWTITQNATSTQATMLLVGSNFTLSSGSTLSVSGTFTNSLGGAATTWTGSTLYLDSGTSYSLNTKAVSGDSYETLAIAANTDVKMWNSSAAAYAVNATGSLYSQDHASNDGDLYIWGQYISTTNEYWSYATDFDGTALGGSSRQVDVRIANTSSVSYSSGTLQMLGASTATTTIANQGSGTYGFAVTGGTLNAQYYSVRNTDATGISISGTPTITSLADGDFELGVDAGTMLTVSSTAIDQNPALQIQRVQFATSTGINSGYNVTESGVPSSYWWFRNHYGNYDGEDYDNDPAGSPGYIRFDDSGLTINVEGNVYSDHGTTPIGAPCDGVTNNVRILVSGLSTSTYSGSCVLGTGFYSIPVTFTGDVVLTAYLDGTSKKAVTVTQTPTTDISDLDLYENALIVRHEDTAALTIDDLAVWDSDDDSDIFFDATSGAPDALVVQPERELFVWGGKSFAPGGNVTLESGGSGNARDGRLELGAASVFTAVTTEAHAIGGGLTVPTGATFTAASSTITFNATTTGKSINAPGVALYNAVFNGVGGGWSLDNTSTTTIEGALTMTAGTLSGTGNISTRSGGPTGNGVIAMTGGTFELRSTGNFGGTSQWQFYNLSIGGPTSGIVTNTGSATTTITNVLRLTSNGTLNAGSAPWILSGSGTPFVESGTFTVGTAPFYYTSTSATNIADTAYALLTLAPSAAGSPTYTLLGGSFTIGNLAIGSGNPVTVNANTNDPSMTVTGNLTINASTTLIASNVGALSVGGSWTNNSTFTHSSGTVTFNSADTGELVAASSSPFYNLTFNAAGGGWTLGSATSTNNTTLTSASSFTLSPSATLSVGGTFTNSVGGAATDWTNSTLTLTSGTTYALNTKVVSGDTYGTLVLAANTDISMWNSSAVTTAVHSSGSLYSQDHAAVDGDLYIWGDYTKASGSDYWSYATDFDGTSLGGSSRQVDVRIASSSTIARSGGVLDIIGSATASTTIAVQGTGSYAFALSGGTLNAQYYSLRNTDPNGLSLSGTPTITTLSNGDFELDLEGGSMMTVTSTVIDANPLAIFLHNSFATSTGITSGFNVTETGTPASYWKFNLHYGTYDGESFDNDPGFDPGQIRWDDSDTGILITGTVYSGEGSGISSVCDDATPVVTLKVQGAGTYTTECASLDGSFSLVDVVFNPGDTLTLFLDTNGGTKAANITIDAVDDIAGMDLYEHRVIVRHEDTAPLTIADMIQYDADQDTDIPFDAEDAATDTLIVQPEHKLIVWTDKTFAPAGNVTIQSGGSGNAWDGSLHLFGTSTFSGAGTQSHSIGGDFTVNANAVFTPANSTVTFAATTTGKTITPNGSSFYNVVFNGTGGNWAFAGGTATSTNDFTITLGTVTLPTATTTVGGSFQNTGGTFMHNNGTLLLNATASGKSIRFNGSNAYNLTLSGVGGAWNFVDTNATSSQNVSIVAGTLTAPSGSLGVGGSFTNTGTFTHNSGVLRFSAVTSGRTITAGGSNFYDLFFSGAGGSWSFTDSNATTTNNLTITAGTTTLPAGVLAVGGSWDTQDRFVHNSGTVKFNASATGKTVTASTSPFYNLEFNSSSGGWTLGNATSTNNLSLTSANSFTLTGGATLSVGGTFTNAVGGGATTWTNSTLTLTSGTSYSINTKSTGTDVYGTLAVTANTDVRLWNSSAATTTVSATGSLYSQDHAAVDGDLYIWGEYVRSSGSDYWSYATDFDGTVLGGSSRAVNVRMGTTTTVTLSGGTFDIIGTAAATTSIRATGTTGYGFAVTGGTLQANYYQFKYLDASGIAISGTPSIISLSHGDLELYADGGTLMTVAGSAIDANASLSVADIRFATSSGMNSGYNVTRTGSPITAWYFTDEYGILSGENFDSDGGDACGYIRWTDSTCLFVSQEHFKWREDDGGEGAPNSEWYNASWSKRKKIAISNPNAAAYTNVPVQLDVLYDADMQSDFDDLRFTDSSGTTSLNFWVESTVASASSTVWVKVPSLPASGSATIYAYYGNGSAISTASGTTTFVYFDDFEDDNITEYSGNTTLFDTSTSFNYSYTYGLDAGVEFGNKTTIGLIRTGSLVAQGQTISFYQYVDTASVDPSEPCTLFAVQGSAQNYAVCLDEDPTERVSIAENVTSDDDSGTVLNSTAVTYTTGWYHVEVDWLAPNSISVTVYDANGDVFATVSTTDSSYSSGGVGYSYWFMYGGWDLYTARPYVASAPTYVFGLEQASGGAAARADEDEIFTARTIGDNLRLRFSIQNTASAIYSRLFRLQMAEKGVSLNCESVPYVNYSDVPVLGSCGTAHACMSSSTHFVDNDVTSPLLSYPASFAFSAGRMVEDPSNQTSSSSIASNAATEVEYVIALTNFASEDAYCFRASNGGLDLDNYTHVAELGLSFAPDISNFSLNDGDDIALTEGSTTTVSAVATVTDRNGYADIISATSTIYRSGVGPSCSAEDNNCYPDTTTTCSFSNCFGNSCTLTCSAEVQYIAEPTDAGSAYEGENWLARVQVEDSLGLMDVQTAGVDMLTLYALSVSPSLDFGSLYVGEDTGTVNATSTIVNTGNSNIDIQVAGTNLTGGASSIAVGEQKFATSTFAYGGCAICQYLTGSATDFEVDLPKPTATTSEVSDEVYWGINIPSGTGATTFTGTNTFWAIGD